MEGGSFFVLEAGVTLIAVAVAFLAPRIGASWLSRLECVLGRLGRRPAMACIAVGLAALALRLMLLGVVPIPEPFIHDEFSHLLAGDTFASGRLTNPAHPLWVHFESFHISHNPTYMSMYFPAQGMALAAGKAIFGHPWYGVWLSAGVMCSAITWMLYGWLPPGWALLGGSVAVLRLGLFSYWVNGYHGGAVAAIGGALVLGAVPRVMRAPRLRDGFAMALGCVVLANSRPYEGLLVCVPAAAVLLYGAVARGRFRMLLAPAVLLLAAAAGMAYYNHRVFGSAWTLPYQLNRSAYALAPVFLWQTPRPEPAYRHAEMRDFYVRREMDDFRYIQSLSGFAKRCAQKFGVVMCFVFGLTLLGPLAMLPRVLRDRRVRYLLLAAGVFGVGLSLNAWLFPHYAAPFLGAFYVLLMQCMRHLRCWKPGGQPYGTALVRVLPAICLALVALRVSAAPLRLTLPRWPAMWYGTEPLGLPRARCAAKLASYPGPQLAIVRYAPDHAPFDDWVYNAADIDRSRVVWAREMTAAQNADLLRYFHDRRAWLVEPDLDPPRISPYPDTMAANRMTESVR